MGLFQKYQDFRESRRQKRIAKAIAMIKDRKAIRDDRAAALDFICGLDDVSERVPALLHRFEYSLEHGINDTREKERAMEGIVEAGEAALPLVRDHLQKTRHIAWPIKILNKIASEDQVVETLKSALNFEDVSFDQAAVDKNYDILCYLRDYKLGSFTDKLTHFLKDPDERVRFAAVEAIVEQKPDEDSIAPHLEGFVSDTSSENRRIRRAVIRAYVDNGWVVQNTDVFESELVAEGIFLTKTGTLEDRSRT